MANLNETFCLKMSPEMKKFLDTFEQPSKFVRDVIDVHMNFDNGLSKIIVRTKTKDGVVIDMDEAKFEKLVKSTSDHSAIISLMFDRKDK